MKAKDTKLPREGSPNGANVMTDVINIKDFYDHETRISIVENAIVNIDKRFDQVDRRFEKLEGKMDSQFKWIIGCIGALSLTTISTLITVITVVSKHT